MVWEQGNACITYLNISRENTAGICLGKVRWKYEQDVKTRGCNANVLLKRTSSGDDTAVICAGEVHFKCK